jgi:hypothetical protein
MTELILSEITRMAGGHCIIGLQRHGDACRSLRPLPARHPEVNAWPADFSYQRGDLLQLELSTLEVFRPHLEDRKSTGILGVSGQLKEEELLDCLRRAEVAASVKDLFGCAVQPGQTGASVHAPRAVRSICGAEARKVRLKWEAQALRAYVALASGEVLPDLPVVDRSWRRFVEAVIGKMSGDNRGQRLNRWLGGQAFDAVNCFVRLGLTRPHPPRWGRCQVMLDTLLPMPRQSLMKEALAQLE